MSLSSSSVIVTSFDVVIVVVLGVDLATLRQDTTKF